MASQLTTERLIWAYANGIFPMDLYGRIAWFSPDPRCIIDLDGFRVPRTLRQVCRQGRYEVRVNADFDAVIRACADRPEGTWISDRIIRAYIELHRAGLAHSVESYRDGDLAGGLYGVSLRGAFFGESMFYRQSNASKVALVHLVNRMRDRGMILLDTQWRTPHLERFGVVEIPRDEYLRRLTEALGLECSFVD